MREPSMRELLAKTYRGEQWTEAELRIATRYHRRFTIIQNVGIVIVAVTLAISVIAWLMGRP